MRNAISIGPVKHATAKYAVYFGDAQSNVYAVNAQNGELLWTAQVDKHFTARITAAPTLYRKSSVRAGVVIGRVLGGHADYPCCTSRGSVVADHANTGKQIWKTYVIAEEPQPTRKNSKGIQLYAPAGASVWNSPTVDAKRKAIYFGTGDSETEPAASTSDSVMALDMNTGKVLWSYQAAAGDAFLGGCGMPNQPENCPKENGPDLDIGNSPVLHTLANGKRMVVAGTKDGNVIALDPDKKGAVIWNRSVAPNPKGTPLQNLNGIVWGGAKDQQNIYYGLSGGGIAAVQLSTGERVWLNHFDTGASAFRTRRRLRPFPASCSWAEPTGSCARWRLPMAKKSGASTPPANTTR